MRVVVLGARGMLGTDLVAALAGREVVALGREDADVRDRDALADAVRGADAVVNASAYTRVDDAEAHEDEAHAVNAVGAENAALAAAATGARLVHVSTDYVFDGSATTPYDEEAPLAPVSAYGRTKAEGERRVRAAHPDALIVRTAWLYGRNGGNFARTMIGLAATRETVSVVTDQIGQPTWTGDLARAIVDLLDAGARSGIYHGTNSGEVSWFGFARAVFETAGLDPDRVLPTDSSAFVRPAPRPAYSVLGHDAWRRAGLRPLRPWREALAAAAAAGALDPDPL